MSLSRRTLSAAALSAMLSFASSLNAQIVDDPFAAPFSLDVHCNAPGNRQIKVAISETKTLFENFDANLDGRPGYLTNRVFDCAPSRSVQDLPSLQEPLYPQIVPGETYYVQVHLSETLTTAADIVLNFDVPPGYVLYLDKQPRSYLAEKISSSKGWMFVLFPEGAESPLAGDFRGPYFGTNFLMDISLGAMEEGFEAGIMRVDREAFINGHWDRRLISIRQRFTDTTFIRDSGAEDGMVYQIYVPGAVIQLTDIEDGCKIEFFTAGTLLTPIDHDENAATPAIFNTASLPLARTWLLTASQGHDSENNLTTLLNLVSIEDDVTWKGQVELIQVEENDEVQESWYFRSGKLANEDKEAWLKEVRYLAVPALNVEPGDWKQRVTVSGYMDENLDGIGSPNEFFSSTIRDDYFEEIPSYGGNGNVRRLIKRRIAPTRTGAEEVYIYSYINGTTGSKGKLASITQPTGLIESRTYYSGEDLQSRQASGRIKTVTKSYPVALGNDGISNYDSEALEITRYTWTNQDTLDFFSDAPESVTVSIKSGEQEVETERIEHAYSVVGGVYDIRQVITKSWIRDSQYNENIKQYNGPKASRFPGRLHAVMDPATGLGTVYEYFPGVWSNTLNTFTYSENGKDTRVKETFGSVSSAANTRIQIAQINGFKRQREVCELAVGDIGYTLTRVAGFGDVGTQLSEYIKYTYDNRRRLIATTDVLRSQVASQVWSGRNLTSITGPEGTRSFEYDSLGRRIRSITEALTEDLGNGFPTVTYDATFEETVYDPMDRPRITRLGSVGSSEVLTQLREVLGVNQSEIITHTDGTITSTSRTLSALSGEGWIITSTAADGTTTSVTHLDDGRIKKVEGAGTAATYYSYGVTTTGNKVTLLRYGSNDTLAPYLLKEFNRTGLLVREQVPALDPSNSVTQRTTSYEYDSGGRLLAVHSTGVPSVRYSHGVPGEDSYSIRKWEDLNSNGIFDIYSEPATESFTRLESFTDNIWEVSKEYVYAKNGTAQRTFIGETRKRLTGWSPTLLGESRVLDSVGHVTTEKLTNIDSHRIHELSVPTGASSITTKTVTLRGRPYAATDALGRVAVFTYDSLGRAASTTDFDGITTSTSYYPNSSRVDYTQGGPEQHQVGYVYFDSSSAMGSRNRLEFQYVISSGHSKYGQGSVNINPSSLDPDDPSVVSVSRFTYDSAGRLYEEFSSGRKKTQHSYDALGRKDTLRIFQSSSVSSLIDWDYHPQTGQLVQRTDTAPGGSGSVSEAFFYHTSGAVQRTVDPRGIGTTYAYGTSADGYAFGRLKSISYDDVVYGGGITIHTPTVSKAYNRMGTLATLNNGVTGLQTFTYDDSGVAATLRLEQVDYDASFYRNAVQRLVLGYEATDGVDSFKGRPNGYRYERFGTTVASATYGYDNLGRRKSVTASGFWGVSELENTQFDFDYSVSTGRLTGVSAALSARSDGAYLQSFDWAQNGRLLSVASGHDGNADGVLDPASSADFVNARYRYTYDSAARKSWELADGFVYGRYVGGGHSTQFQYDNLGQLKRARTHQGLGTDEYAPSVPGRDFGFTFDNAGNRTGISVDETLRSFTVAASHAYQSRQNFAYGFYSGMADQSVTIGGVAPMQTQGDFFHHPRGVANQSSAVWDQATIASGTHSATIGQVVAPRNQSFTYDDAGNLLEDGVWRYYYDAVNRLRRMDRVEGITGLPSTRNLRLEFRYDEQGRRVEKKVIERGSDSILSFQRFIYEGWNLVGTLEVEGEGTEQTAGLATRYVWRTGSADTGSFGLLMVAGDHDNDPTTLPRAYFTGYDGRGNLTSLAENRQGVAAAAWEYSPFGEVLRVEGSAELPNLASLGATFGFSTQYTDAETGLVYFGHRYYHPGMGRFLNKDPLGEAGGLNRYAYALNDPINRTDYRGLSSEVQASSGGWDLNRIHEDSIYNDVYVPGLGMIPGAYTLAGIYSDRARNGNDSIRGRGLWGATGYLSGSMTRSGTLLTISDRFALSTNSLFNYVIGKDDKGKISWMWEEDWFDLRWRQDEEAREEARRRRKEERAKEDIVYPVHHYAELENGRMRLSYGGAGSGIYSEGSKEEMEILAKALDQIYAVPYMQPAINSLINASRNSPLINIGYSGYRVDLGDSTDIETGAIYWNPQRGGEVPAFVALAHEIHHAYEYVMGTIRGISPYVGRNPPWEVGALRAENEVRRFYRIKEKEDYTKGIYSWMPGKPPILMLEAFKVEVSGGESE